MARPEAEIDVEHVRKLAEKQWSDEQIAAFVGVHKTTIQRRFALEIANARHNGRAKLIDLLWSKLLKPSGKDSDKLLIHALNRFLGPIEKKMTLNLKNLSLEDKKVVLHELVKELDTDGQSIAIGPGESEIVSTEDESDI